MQAENMKAGISSLHKEENLLENFFGLMCVFFL